MTISKALATIILCGLLGTAAGAGLGYCIGRWMPDFFIALFMGMRDADVEFNPVQVGVALGLINGLFTGLAVGGGAVLASTWYAVRKLVA